MTGHNQLEQPDLTQKPIHTEAQLTMLQAQVSNYQYAQISTVKYIMLMY